MKWLQNIMIPNQVVLREVVNTTNHHWALTIGIKMARIAIQKLEYDTQNMAGDLSSW